VDHCGSCGNRCAAVPGGTATCSSGTCGARCPSPLTLCGGRCVNLRTDPANCAACGRACPVPAGATGAACVASTCTGSCSGGRSYCGTTCVDTASDRNHCGGCGNDCPSPRPCAGGICESCERIDALPGQATFPCSSRDPGLPEPCCVVHYSDGRDVFGRCVTRPGQMAPFGSCIR
jgi:hypothetical protein